MKTSNPTATSTTSASQDKKKRPHKKKKKNKAKEKSIPEKGDPDYLTPTQLRNRRKRRAKQQKSNSSCSNGFGVSRRKEDGDAKEAISSYNKSNFRDPSMTYISNPRNAPVVQAAKQYFRSIQKQKRNLCSAVDFQVHLGPIYGWRTVSKLAVRPDESTSNKEKPSVAIGLFLPQSHTLLPVPNCRAHHTSINQVVQCITKACHEVGIAPYQEGGEPDANGTEESAGDKGKGQLRYICVNIERKTGAAQLTLVWNGDAPNDDAIHVKKDVNQNHTRGISDPHLAKLVAKILSMSNSSASSNGNSSLPVVRETRQERTCNVVSISPTNDPPAKKRRRRGNREGDSSVKEDTNAGNPNTYYDSMDVVNLTQKIFHTNDTTSTQTLTFDLHSLWINYNSSWKHSNAILAYDSSCWKHIHGPPAIVEHLDFEEDSTIRRDSCAHPTPLRYPIPLHFPPNVFRQANLDAFTNIVARIRQRVIELDKSLASDCRNTNFLPSCIELYGGVGTIGLHVSDIVSSLVSSDENPNNAKCFNDSVKTFPIDIQPRLEYKQKNAKDMIITESSLFQKCCVLIVDPPRKGLDKEVVDYLCNTGWQTLKLVVYISCGFQAFQRDCDAILGSERWKLEFVEGYLLFPGSDAIETLAMFVPL
ncbi:hypothetical protein ACHAW6_007501 [Cyclotella cf. meneghiniana]